MTSLPLNDPVLLALLGSAVVTAAILVERRLRSRLHAMDTWAERRALRCERHPSLQVVAPLEPFAVVGAVVAVERLLRGTIQVGNYMTEVLILACLTGARRRPSRRLVGVFPGSPELPSLRVLPAGEIDEREAPGSLGFSPTPASALPEGYRAESFQPLARAVTRVLGEALGPLGAGWRVELRPGRIILVAPTPSPEHLDPLLNLGGRLGPLLHEALQPPPPTTDGQGKLLN